MFRSSHKLEGMLALGLLLASWGAGCSGAGCSGAESSSAAGAGGSLGPGLVSGKDDERARSWLSPATGLPSRAEVVALSDRLSIAAAKTKKDESRLELTRLAAALRERLWRFNRSGTDGREAVELLGQVVESAAASALSCEADSRRAALLAEMRHDATLAYRELYLALRRQTAPDKGREERRECVLRIERMLAAVQAFRPTGAAWQELEAEAAQQASVQQSLAEPLASAAASGSGSAGDIAAPPPGGEVVVVPDASMVKDKALLRQVQPYSWKLGGRVVLSLSAPALYEAGMLPPDPKAGRGHRVYLDLLNTTIKGPKKDLPAGGLIERVRLGKRKDGTRVVVDLSAHADRRIFYLPDPFRVVIDLSTHAPEVPAAAPGGKRAVRRITLDPGHGGWDDGAVGPTGLREKDVALDVAHRAAPALATELGVETMLTRDTDVFVSLEERTARANAFQSDLFVSIHCNATENGQATGMEVYILDPSRQHDKEGFRVAHRENMSSRHKPTGSSQSLDEQVTSIAAGLQLDSAAAGSRLFADLLRKSAHASFATRYPGNEDHGVKTAGFFVLLGAAMPAVLFETAFISNPEDEARLATADYRQKLADAVVNAVRAYRDGHQ